MLKSKKNVFWEALIMTLVIFLAGLFLGMLIESSNSNKINTFYFESEISLTDASALSSLSAEGEFDCKTIKKSNIDFADRVYREAILLEEYQESGRLTDNMEVLRRKYDLLRTLIWSSNTESLDRCKNYNILVYLYEAEVDNVAMRAKQNVWSKILLDVKKENNDSILLLPIAVDQNLTSLDLIVSDYEIKEFPVVIINNKDVLHVLENKDHIGQFLY